MSNLVIVESPAKCQKIQGFLGAGWRVIATMGHIRALEQSLEAIGLENDFEAKYEFLKEKAKAIKQLKECAKEATTIYLASDSDREGENISYSVCLLLKLNPKTALRSVFNEITEKAVKKAIENPRRIDMNIVYAQQARAILDMMIGFTMSPLLWKYVGQSLSAGRCQTPALRLVIDRENQIDSFKTSSSWKLSTTWKYSDFIFESVMEDELEDEESTLNYMDIVHSTPSGSILFKEIKPWTERAPQPLITSTLQQQASAIYNCNPKNTMKIAQRLYEAGHITYMRTDKAVMSEEAKEDARKWVLEKYGAEYLLDQKEESKVEDEKEVSEKRRKPKIKSKPSDKKEEVKAQEAHEAIRPTHMERYELDGVDWSLMDKKIYKLIWQRAIQSVMSSVRGEVCRIKTQIEGDEDFQWISQWKQTIFEGWRCVGKVLNVEEEDEDEQYESKGDVWKKVLLLKVGDKVEWTRMKAEPKETKAQGRYTEATLIRELEKYGIGRPSTFSSLITVIQEKNYVEAKDIVGKEIQIKEYELIVKSWPPTGKELKKKMGAEKNKLVPTALGKSVLEFMLKHFDDLFNYGFTGEMEKRLDRIAEGEEEWKNVLRDMWDSYKERYNELHSKKELNKKEAGQSNPKVHEFAGGLKAVQTKKGPLLLVEREKKEDTIFLGWPDRVSFDDMTEEIAIAFQRGQKKESDQVGEWNDQLILKKSGKFGVYLQCGDLSIPYQENEELEKTIERFEGKQKQKGDGNGIIQTFKEYTIRTGPYGPYIIKTSVKKVQFVSVPKGLDASKLTEKDIEGIYKTGLETKKNFKSYKK
jgi:DNA topoisomerase-1